MSEPNNGGPAMADPFEAIRAHVEKNASKERATFTVAGVKALLAAVDAAALSAAAQPAPAVKELEWEGDIAVSMAGSYLVVPYRDRFGLVGPDDSLDGFSHRVTGSREECKAAAQKDFETRILSALLFPCEACDGSGVQVFATRVYEPGCGYAHDSSDERSCDQCAGTGKREAAQADFEARIRSALIPTAQAGECSEATETLTPMSGFLTFIKDMRFTGSWDLPTLNRVIEVGEAIAEQNPSPAQGTVERAEPVDELGSRIKKVMEEEDHNGASCGWRSCTGCHETNEGAETGHYPYSKAFGCYVGAGCGECGGLGVVWEYWSKDALDEMARDLSEEPAAPPDGDAAKALRVLELSEAEIADVIAPYFTEGYSAYDAAQAVIRLAKRRGERP